MSGGLSPDPKKKTITRFGIVVIGDYGRGRFKRPDRQFIKNVENHNDARLGGC